MMTFVLWTAFGVAWLALIIVIILAVHVSKLTEAVYEVVAESLHLHVATALDKGLLLPQPDPIDAAQAYRDGDAT